MVSKELNKMNALPKLKMTMDRLPDPAWTPQYGADNMAINMDQYYLNGVEVEVEVLSLNLNSGGMRVRFDWPQQGTGKLRVITRDVDISGFFNAFEIKSK